MDPITDTKLTDKATENQDHFNSIHDQSPNTNQGNSVVLYPLYSEEHIDIHPRSRHYTGPTETCVVPRTPQPVEIKPIFQIRQSSEYSANGKTIISQDTININTSLHQGTVLCAIVSKAQIKFENGPRHHKDLYKDKKKLIWKRYNAIIRPNGQLELYKACQCKDKLFHLHTPLIGIKRPRYKIDLRPCETNILFNSGITSNHVHPFDCTLCFQLLLQSPIDYSWSLSSPEQIFFFQSSSVKESRDWYHALYMTLPVRSKRHVPKTFNLFLPQIPTVIAMPLEDLLLEKGHNVDLNKVRDSALALLHHDGLRPSGWNKRTIGICWKSPQNDMDWALKPMTDTEQTNTVYLVEPRLIEKTHELQMRLYTPPLETTILPKPSTYFAGYARDASRIRKISKRNQLLYVSVIDHLLFLFAIGLPVVKNMLGFKKKLHTIPTVPPHESEITPRNAIGVLNMCEYEKTDETLATVNDARQHLLHVGNSLLLEVIDQEYGVWSRKLDQIKAPTENEHVKSESLYVKPGTGDMSTFKQRLCVLTKDGDLCLFKTTSERKMYRTMKTVIRINSPDFYIYSGAECCKYINGIPLFQNARLYNSNIESINHRPTDNCFVIITQGKEHVFFTESKKSKDEWVQSICQLRK